MRHYFNTELAQIVGINAAVIYHHFCFWCKQNEKEGVNERDGLFWTFHSASDLVKFFPYFTKRQILYAIKKLEEKGLIRIGCYNKLGMDRTYWYTVLDYQYFPQDTNLSLGETILSHRETNLSLAETNLSLASNNFVPPIPNRTPNRTHHIEHTDKESRTFRPPSVDEVRAYCLERGNSVDAEQFVDFYTSKGWKVGKDKMKDWKACVRTWEKRDDKKPAAKKKDTNPYRELLKQKGLFDDPTGDNFPFK